MEDGYSVLTRRERLERIATAERDRRAGRVEVAVAALGEATEWPARVVLALASLSELEAPDSRRILEEGLDIWVDEVGLASLDQVQEEPFERAGEGSPSLLDRPIESDELEYAFAEAEAQTDEMRDVNDVAERVLMTESVGFAALAGDDLVASDEYADEGADVVGMDSAARPESSGMDTFPASEPSPSGDPLDSHRSHGVVVATLSRWLENLDDGRARRVQ